MISAAYKNSKLYYSAMKNFLDGKTSAWEFKRKYWDQRDEDLNENKANSYSDYYLNRVLVGKEKIFEEEYSNLLYEEGVVMLWQYEQGAKKLDIKGELFFMGLWYFIDDPIREYYPSDDEGFDSRLNIDEKTLRNRVQAVFGVLERNKDRWM